MSESPPPPIPNELLLKAQQLVIEIAQYAHRDTNRYQPRERKIIFGRYLFEAFIAMNQKALELDGDLTQIFNQ